MFLRVLVCCLVGTTVVAQPLSLVKSVEKKADSLYGAKNYEVAASAYHQLADLSDYKSKKAAAYYNLACCLALWNQPPDSALTYLGKAIATGYNNKGNMLKDNDLVSLHRLAQWNTLLAGVPPKPAANTDPAKARFVTTDIPHFWTAWDKAYQDTSHFSEIFKTEYFDKASRGMDDYMALKVESIDAFVAHVKSAPKFYQSIRGSMFQVDKFQPLFQAAFRKLKQVYPAATFPDVYFVIGAMTSGGTVSGNGLLLGVNQASLTDTTVVNELSARTQTRLSKVAYLPYVVAHESIHFQQGGIKGDTITLGYAINEGMADFIGELISGHVPDQPLFDWAKGKEQSIWKRFTADMYLNRYDNWIANSKQAGPNNPPDQGYWVGYQICRAYYKQAKDKKKAIDDMLHIQDYRKFLAQSGWEQKVARNQF